MTFRNLVLQSRSRWPDPLEDKRMEAAIADERAGKPTPSRMQRILAGGATSALLAIGADVTVQSSDTANKAGEVMREAQDQES